MSAPRFYVRIDRDDNSRTYRGPWIFDRCRRERDAWRQAFPAYDVTIVERDNAEVRADVRQFDRATKPDVFGRSTRYYPEEVDA